MDLSKALREEEFEGVIDDIKIEWSTVAKAFLDEGFEGKK